MSNKPKAKTNITRITANSSRNSETKPEKTETPIIKSEPQKLQKSQEPKAQKPTKIQKSVKNTGEKPLKEVFILARPFVALGRYLRDSWREIRQVRWPNRKATWKMTVAVFVYCAIFMAFILILDALFTFIFDILLGIN